MVIEFDATANYHRPLAYCLGQCGFELRLPPLPAVARTQMHGTTPGRQRNVSLTHDSARPYEQEMVSKIHSRDIALFSCDASAS